MAESDYVCLLSDGAFGLFKAAHLLAIDAPRTATWRMDRDHMTVELRGVPPMLTSNETAPRWAQRLPHWLRHAIWPLYQPVIILADPVAKFDLFVKGYASRHAPDPTYVLCLEDEFPDGADVERLARLKIEEVPDA